MKKVIAILIGLVLIIGGCSMFNKRLSLTKEQQENVVIKILRRYEGIHEIKFLRYNRDFNTGYFHLSIEINGDSSKRTTMSFSNTNFMETEKGGLSLNPVNTFETFKRKVNLDDDFLIDLQKIKIVFLEE